MNVKELLEKHPYAVGAGVFVIGLVGLYFYTRGGTSQAVSIGPSDAQIAADVQLAQVQAGQQTAQAQTAAQLQALSEKNATDVQIATLDQGTQLAALTANQNIANTNAGVQTTSVQDQLAAALASIDAQVKQATINSNTAIALQQQSSQENEFRVLQEAQLQEAISANQTTVATTQIAAAQNINATNVAGNVATTQALTDAQVQIAKINASAQQNSSLFSGLFGLGGSIVKAFL